MYVYVYMWYNWDSKVVRPLCSGVYFSTCRSLVKKICYNLNEALLWIRTHYIKCICGSFLKLFYKQTQSTFSYPILSSVFMPSTIPSTVFFEWITAHQIVCMSTPQVCKSIWNTAPAKHTSVKRCQLDERKTIFKCSREFTSFINWWEDISVDILKNSTHKH